MTFQVFVQRYGQEPEAVSGQISAKGALRLMGSYIRGKRFSRDHCKVYAVGSRYGWTYSQQELASLVSYQPAIRKLAEDCRKVSNSA
jgi:hypothetical protein